jgi:hypothetical protein
MVKRWKDEIVLGIVLLVCSAFGGFFGAKMAQIESPKAPVVLENSQTFGSLPPAESVPMDYADKAPVIVIVVNESTPHEKAVHTLPRVLNPVQQQVNFI